MKQSKDWGNIPITLDMTKVVKKSHHLYIEQLRQEAAKNKEKHKGRRKGKSRSSKGKIWRKGSWRQSSRWEVSEAENGREREAHYVMGKAMSYIDEGGKEMHDGLKAGNMMEIEAGSKLIEFGRQKQSEAQGRLEDISKDKDLIQNQLSKKSVSKKQKN